MEALPVKMKRLCALFLALVLTLGLCSCSIGKKGKYEKAVEAVRNGHYTEAIENLEELEGYEDSAKYIAYARAIQAGDSGDYEAAITALKALNGFERSAVYITSYTTLAAEAERARMKDTYNQAVADVKAGKYDEAISAFETLNDYEDSGKYIMYTRCLKAGDSGDYETAIKSLTALGDFKEAGMYIQYFTALRYEANQQYEEAGEVYDGILLFKDAQARNAALPDKILDRDLAEAEREFEQEKSWSSLREMIGKTYTTSATRMYENVMGFAAKLHEKQDYEKAAAAYYLLLTEANYEKADAGFKESFYQYVCVLMTDGEYADAREYINEYISGYKDADERALECSYQLALRLEARGTEKAQAAYNAFKELATYKDSADHAAAYEAKYAEATSKREANDFDAAIALFSELGTYSDASAKRKEAQNAKAYAAAASLMNSEQYEEAIEAFRALNGYSDGTAQIEACEAAILEREYQKAVKLKTDEQYEEAIEAFRALNGYSDGTAQIEACEAAILEREYQKAVKLKTDEKYEAAINAFRALNGYSDSAEQIMECAYRSAEKLRKSGKYAEAYVIYATIQDYKDVGEIMTNDAGIAKVVAYQPGNYVTFGTYPQTKSGTDQTPIEWLVLESDGETALLISRYALDAKPYNTEYESITWEKCTLRGWLNSDLYNRAFSAEEKKTILVSDVSADKNPPYWTNPGNATKDSVFLLSIIEANKYFANNEARMCAATDYAIEQGTYTNSKYTVDGREACWWWLRSPGIKRDYAAIVISDGSIYDYGSYVYRSSCAVRPCVRVRLF